MIEKKITLVSIGQINDSLLEYIRQSIRNTFHLESHLNTSQDLMGEVPDPVYGGKYNSTTLIKQLSECLPEKIFKMVAITEMDLYSPIFSCFFGEAQLNGCCALVSLHRLHQEYYGLAQDDALFRSRCEKEVVHEISHLFGLVHCNDSYCIMYPSNNIIDTDVKSSSFCPSCQVLIERALG
jgi:archaemetzincin